MEFTGERMVPEYNAGKQIYAEHMSRYLFATQFTVDKEVLDIACGSGYGSHLLLVEGKSKTIVGVDIAKETVDYCKEKYKSEKLSFVVGSCEEIPLPDKSFDVVVSFETIEHINNHAGFLKEIKRVLRANGILVMSTPNADISQKENHFHVHEINVGEFDNMLMKHFKHLKLFYQDIGLGSYICGSEHNNFKAYSGYGELENKGKKSTYIIAVCSDMELEEIKDTSFLTGDEDIKFMKDYCVNLEKELKGIYNSKKWKLISKMVALLKRTKKTKPEFHK